MYKRQVLINAPSFESAEVDLGGSPLTIETQGFDEPDPLGPAQYVQSVHVDGSPLERSWLTGNELRAASHLRIALGPTPSTWGTATRPPSANSPSGSNT